MAIHVSYTRKKRSFRQNQLDDWLPHAFDNFDRWHQEMQEWLRERKKEFYQQLPEYLKELYPKPRRGRKKKLFASRSCYHTNIKSEYSELKRFEWFSRKHDMPEDESASPVPQDQHAPESLPKGQKSLDSWLPETLATPEFLAKNKIPKFRAPRIAGKDEFCNDMTNLGWLALHQYRDAPAGLLHLFYMNDFSMLDDDTLICSSKWKEIGAYLPSDIVKYAIGQLMLGFSTYTDYLRMADLIPHFEDQLAIRRGRHPPSGDRLVQGLRAIGVDRLRAFSEDLTSELRARGLEKDVVWLWDGVFVEAWMKHDRKQASRNKTALFGGWYNHGGKKKGFGVVLSVIVDWGGYVPIPVSVEAYPANENDNVVFRDTFNNTLEDSEVKPRFLATDKGPSGRKSIDLVASKNIIPIIALGDNRKADFVKTSKNEYKFDTITTAGINEAVLEKVYMMRTRIEELFSNLKAIFKMARLHGTGKEYIEIESILLIIVLQLIPITAFKIGKPNLEWKISAFREMKINPEDVFPDRTKELRKP